MKTNKAMKVIFFLAATLLSLMPVTVEAQRKQSFDEGWRFHRGEVMNAEAIDCDDSRWREVIVPHDFSMEPVAYAHDYREQTAEWKDWQVGPFSRLSIGDWDSGQTVGGTGWYRKTFTLPANGASLDEMLQTKTFRLRFDGVYNQAEVWVNGRKAAMNVYGYMPFVVDLNRILRDKANRNPKAEHRVTIAVKAVNEGLNCRWYSGSGIFRHVWLETTDRLHLDEWDTYVDASEGNKVKIKTHSQPLPVMEGSDYSGCLIKVEIMDATGKVVATRDNVQWSMANVQWSTELTVKSPHLWSIDNPYRYKARISLLDADKNVRDVLEIPFGIRTIAFSADKGFLLNGKQVKLRGGCVHHDNGLLGSAAIDRAEVRKVELMKAQGYNAVRTSHNLPTEAFLNACDSLGMLVIDECFDQWEEQKRKDDYSNYFSKEKQTIIDGKPVGMGVTNFEYDAALMVRRDRNHPSVIMWSIGNEIAQRSDVPRGKEIAEAITRAIKLEDSTRPTTLAVNDYWDRTAQKMSWDKDSPRAFDLVEVGGYNYEQRRYESDHEKFPERIMYGSETYPNAIASNWRLVEKHPYVIGDFVWTAIDYIGEAGLGHALERSDRGRWIQLLAWPWFNAWCGDIDLVGNKKPQSYYRDVVWGVRPIAMAVRPSVTDGEYEDAAGWCWTAEENHWNWHEQAFYDGPDKCGYLPIDIRPEKYDNATLKTGVVHDVNGHRSDSLRVNVYTRESRVRLSVNGRVIGEQDVNPNTYTATFRVAYEPGELKAEVVKAANKREQARPKVKEKKASVVFRTSGAPAAIQFEPVNSSISSSHNDLAYIYIKVVDADGNLCPTAEIPLDIKTSGVRHIAVAGTGHPYDVRSFRSPTPTTFRGQALLIIQPQEEKGDVTINVTSPEIKSQGTHTVRFY
jgi:beta-galactosidase